MTAMTAAVPTKADERRALGVACGAHVLHDGECAKGRTGN